MVVEMDCPECGSGNVERYKDLEKEMYHGDHLIWDVKVYHCKDCNWYNILFTTHRKFL
ncbi:MAG: hypothetical protein ACMUIG_01825 [Thermoplasmatota archaeon]